jgi:outer membrane protein assembly factor BamB
VEFPSVVALSATDGGACWSALSNWNAYAVAVADGRVLVSGSSCGGDPAVTSLVAIDAASGKEQWRFEPLPVADAAFSDSRPPVLGAGEKVVIASSGDSVTAIDLETGERPWSLDGAGALADGPDFAVLHVGDPAGRTMAVVDRRTGAERWRTTVDGEFLGGVAADSSAVLVTTGESTVAYDAHTGKLRWEAPFTQASDTAAVRIVDGVASGVAGTGATPNATLGYDVATGRHLWASPATPVQLPEPTDGNVYVSLENLDVGALDPRSGALRWRDSTGGMPIWAGPGLVVAAGDVTSGELRALDPTSGQERWTRPIDETGLPGPDALTPNGSPLTFQNLLPSSAGVFVTYGNCLGS